MAGHVTGMVCDEVLMICAEGNLASARTIEHCGGVLEEARATELGPQRRYWIDLPRR